MDAFKMLLTNKRYADYIDQLETLFKELSLQLSTISIRKTRGIMGIPNNWKRLKTLHQSRINFFKYFLTKQRQPYKMTLLIKIF